MQVIQEIQINNHKVSLFNTVEEPLFEAKQVIETVLEYTELNECRFYRDNKTNESLIAVTRQPTGSLTDGQKGIKGVDNQYSNETIYLTEFGLYECLFASKKPTAQQFRLQVMTLLRDLRIGNLRLIVQKECETTKLLQANKESLLAEITKTSELEKQVLYLQARLEKASEEVSVYEIEIDGKIYRGTALQLIRRLKQHLMNSCNPSVRQMINSKKTNRSFSTGAEVKMRLLHTQKVSNRDERNYIESEFVKRIPSTQRLNRNIPRVRDFSNVSEECKSQLNMTINNPTVEEVKIQVKERKPQVQYKQQEVAQRLNKSIPRVADQSLVSEECKQELTQALQQQKSDSDELLDDDLTTICEVNDIEEDKDLKSKLLKIKQFIDAKGEYPLQKSEIAEERSLAMTVQYLRRGRKGTIKARGKLISIKDSTVKMVEEIIPGFIWANHKSKYQLTDGVSLVKQKKPKTTQYQRVTDGEFKEQLAEFLVQNPRKLRDRGSDNIETKFYKKIKNLVVQRTPDQLKEYFGAELYAKLQQLAIC